MAGETAREPDRWQEYIEGARARERLRRQQLARRRARAWDIARRAAALLKEEFGATRVVVFGSLAHGAWFHPHSDIDLAAEGIPPERFWRAGCRLEEIAEGFEIDLVALETASPSLRETIEKEGVEL